MFAQQYIIANRGLTPCCSVLDFWNINSEKFPIWFFKIQVQINRASERISTHCGRHWSSSASIFHPKCIFLHFAHCSARCAAHHCTLLHFRTFLSTLQIYKVIVQWKMDAVKSCNLGQSIKYSSKLPQMQWNTFNPVFIFATTNTFLQQQIYFF